MKKIVLSLAISSIPALFFAQNNNNTELNDVSYAIGMDIANSMKKQNLEINLEYFTQAFKDIHANKNTLIHKDSASSVIQRYFAKKMENQKQENLKKNEEFLAKNKNNKNIKTTQSGLQYEVIQPSKLKIMDRAVATDTVKVKYTGKLLDGTIFDSTDKNGTNNPIEIPLNQVIPGWTEGIQLMDRGSIYRFYIPPTLGYGETPAGPIPPNSLLIFDVELVEVLRGKKTKKEESPQATNQAVDKKSPKKTK